MIDILLSVIYVVFMAIIVRLYFEQTMWNFKYGHGLEENGGNRGDFLAALIVICIISPFVPQLIVLLCIAGLIVSQTAIYMYIKKQNNIIYADDKERREAYSKEIKKNFTKFWIEVIAVGAAILITMIILK